MGLSRISSIGRSGGVAKFPRKTEIPPNPTVLNLSNLSLTTTATAVSADDWQFLMDPTGTKFFQLSQSEISSVPQVLLYTVGTAFDISTLGSPSSMIETPGLVVVDRSDNSLTFKPDGTKFYFTGYQQGGDGSRYIGQVDLNTPWSLDLLYYGLSEAIPERVNSLQFNSTGTQLFYWTRDSNDMSPTWFLRRMPLTTAYDIFTLQAVDQTYTFNTDWPSSPLNQIHSVKFNSLGTRLYLFHGYNTISQYNLSTPWNITDMVYSGTQKNLNTISDVNYASRGSIWIDNSSFRLYLAGKNDSFVSKLYQFESLSEPYGSTEYVTPGTYTWVAPEGVTSVSVVAVGGGGSGSTNGGSGGGGGGLGWKNNISVVPGNSYTVVVGLGGPGRINGLGSSGGGDSYFIDTLTVLGGGGQRGADGGAGGTFVGDGGGTGGLGGQGVYTYVGGGGGGAGGYDGAGGQGGNGGFTGFTPAAGTSGSAGLGGGGGGGSGEDQGGGSGLYAGPSGGGGVSIYGQGANGAGGVVGTGSSNKGTQGRGGSGGSDGLNSIISDTDTGRGRWGTNTGTLSGNIITFGPTAYAFVDSLANFGSNFVGLRFHWNSTDCDTDLYIVANVSGTGVNSQWQLNKTPSTTPTGSNLFLVTRLADGGGYGGGGGGGDGNGLDGGQGASGAVRIYWYSVS